VRHIHRKQETRKVKNRENKKTVFRNRKQKKQEIKVMKTKNRFQKAAAVLAALGLTLVLLTHPAEAQGFGKASDDNGTKTRKSAESVNTISAARYAAELAARKYTYVNLEVIDGTDPELQFENWMFDSRNFVPARVGETATETSETQKANTNDSLATAMEALLIVDTEKPLKLESWMMDEKCFRCETKNNNAGFYTENIRVK
jgi:hypothetical protein